MRRQRFDLTQYIINPGAEACARTASVCCAPDLKHAVQRYMALPMLSRRLFGLVAAYAIALQAVLTGVSALPVAGFGSAGLCTVQDGTTLPAAPTDHGDQQCC